MQYNIWYKTSWKEVTLKDLVGPRFGVFQGEHGKIKVWHESQKMETLRDGSTIFQVEVAGTYGIKFWIMSWGSKALVVEPESLRDEIRAEAQTMPEKYGK